MKSVLLGLFLWVLMFGAKAQKDDTIHIYGQLSGNQANFPWKVGLSQYHIPKSISRTLVINTYGGFSYEAPASGPAFYALTFKEGDFNFIVTPAEKSYHLSVSFDEKGLTGVSIDGSRENDAYRLFAASANPFMKKLMLYLQGSPWQDTIPFSEYWKANAATMQNITVNYKGTFTADVLATALLPDSNSDITPGYFRQHLLKFKLLNNPGFYNLPFVADLISVYTTCFIDSSATRAFNSYDHLFRQVTDSTSLVRLQDLIFQLYLFHENEIKLGVFADWAGQHPQLVTSIALKMQLDRYGKIMPGKPVPEMVDSDLAKVRKSLITVARANKTTLYVIWSPQCDHCREEVPQLISLYDKYHPLGFEIFSSAIDCTKEDWRKFSEQNGLNWVNTYHGNPPGINPLDAFMVTYTPTYILVDAKGNVISRFTRFGQLESFLGR